MTFSVSQRIRSLLQDFPLAWGMAPLDTVRLQQHSLNVQNWVDSGHHGAMSWLAESAAVRGNPVREWPWARSVLMVRQPYALPRPQERGLAPVVAGYARVPDYHDSLGVVLRGIKAALHREFPELQSVWFVDSFPIPEAELAVQTGLGWRGKNTLVLHQKAGSAFHLGGLLLSLEGIEPSDPVANFCGKCTACLDACPTGALLGNGLLDAGKCLSHWNLEDRSVTEGVAAEAARSEILGCDICQQVCPWNHKLMQELPLPERWPQSWEDWIRLCLPQGGFQSLFKRTPLDRPGRARILKVLLRALYNVDKERLRAIAPEVLERETRPEIRAWLEQCGVLPSSGA